MKVDDTVYVPVKGFFGGIYYEVGEIAGFNGDSCLVRIFLCREPATSHGVQGKGVYEYISYKKNEVFTKDENC